MTEVEQIRVGLDAYADIVAAYRAANSVRTLWKPYEEHHKDLLLKVFRDIPRFSADPDEAGTLKGEGLVDGQASLTYQVVTYYTMDMVRLRRELPDVVAAYKTKPTTTRKLLVVS